MKQAKFFFKTNETELSHSFCDEKRPFVLFLGAGINCSMAPELSWGNMVKYLLKKSVSTLSVSESLSAKDCEGIINKLISNANPYYSASVIKKALGNQYISFIQHYLYTYCNKSKIKTSLEQKPYPASTENNMLLTVADLLLSCDHIKALARLERFFNLENREGTKIDELFLFKTGEGHQKESFWNLDLITQMKYSCIENKIQYFPVIKFPAKNAHPAKAELKTVEDTTELKPEQNSKEDVEAIEDLSMFPDEMRTNLDFLETIKLAGNTWELRIESIVDKIYQIECKEDELADEVQKKLTSLYSILFYFYNISRELRNGQTPFEIPRSGIFPGWISEEETEKRSKIIYSCLREYITDKFIRHKISDKIQDSSNALKEIINKHVQDQVTLNSEPICREILEAKIFPAIDKDEIYKFIKQLEFDKQKVSELAEMAFENQSVLTDMVKGLTSLQDSDCQELAQKITSKLGPRFTSKIEKVFNVSIHSGELQNSTSIDKVYSKSPVQYFLDYITDITDTRNTLYPCIVFDGLNILNEQEKRMINLHHVIQVLREKAFFSIIVFDGIDQDDRAQDYLSDMIIELRGEEKKLNYFMHDLRIHKARYQPAAIGWHQYKIRDFGLLVFKSLHFQSHKANYMDSRLMQSFITPQLKEKKSEDPNSEEDCFFNIEKILYRPKPGSFTVILGPRATFKTKLCLSFLYGKVETPIGKEEGDSLLISLVDNLGVLENSCSCQFQQAFDNPECVNKNCTNKFYIFHIRPGIISPEEFFYYLQRRIDEHESRTNKKITRLAFWDLTQIDYRFPMFLNNPMFLSTLVEFGKERNIAMCIMGAGNSKLTPSASAIADNVIFCWRDTLKKDHPENSKDAFIFLNSNLPREKDDRFCDEYLALYVDRCQGLLGGEGRELTYLPL